MHCCDRGWGRVTSGPNSIAASLSTDRPGSPESSGERRFRTVAALVCMRRNASSLCSAPAPRHTRSVAARPCRGVRGAADGSRERQTCGALVDGFAAHVQDLVERHQEGGGGREGEDDTQPVLRVLPVLQARQLLALAVPPA